MEAYLQHLKSLREHMNDHEDKVAWLSAEHSDQQTHIRHLQKDLESVRTDTNRTKDEVETIGRDSVQTSKLIISCQKGLGTLHADSHALSQACELMNEDLRRESIRLHGKKLHYEQLEADARSQLDQYQAYYEQEMKEEFQLNAELEKAAESAPGVEQKKDHEASTDDVEMVEAGIDRDKSKLADAESRLRRLRDEIQSAEEQLKTVDVDSAQLETGRQDCEEDLGALKEEKLAEEDFMQTLYSRLEQLQDYSEDVVCSSCMHAYVIEYKNSKFVVRDTGGER